MSDEEHDLIARLRVTGQSAWKRAMGEAAKGPSAVGSASKTAAMYTRDLGSSARGAVSPVKALLGLGTGWALVSAFKNATEAGFGFNKMIDSQRIGFTTLLGSADKAEQFMARIQKLALASPVLDPQTTGDAARLLMAYGLAAKDTLPFVKALGDMTAATGRSIAETLPRGAMAIGQISSKGKLQAEEINQLAESIGLSRKAIRKELKMTADEFEATFTPGNSISAEKALPAIMRAMEKQSGGAAKRLAKTTAGRLDQLREVFKKKMGGFTRGAYDQVGKFAYGLTKRLQNIDPAKVMAKGKRTGKVLLNAFSAGKAGRSDSETQGFTGLGHAAVIAGRVFAKVQPILKGIGPVLATIGRGAMQGAKQLLDAFKPIQPFLKNILLPFVEGLAIGIGATLLGAFKIAVVAIKLVSTALGWLGKKAAPITPIIRGVGVIVGAFLGGPVLKALSWLPKLGKLFEVTGVFLTKFGSIGGKVAGFTAKAFMKIFKVGFKVASFFGGWWIKVHKIAFKEAWKAVSYGGGKIVGFLGKLGKVVGGVLKIVGKIAGGFKKAFEGVAGFVGKAMGAVVAVLTESLNKVIGFINKVIRAFNKLPGPDIGQIDPIGGDEGNGPKGKPGSPGGGVKMRKRKPSSGKAGGDPRGIFKSNASPAARLGPMPLTAGDAGLFTVNSVVKIRERELGRASTRVTKKDQARK